MERLRDPVAALRGRLARALVALWLGRPPISTSACPAAHAGVVLRNVVDS